MPIHHCTWRYITHPACVDICGCLNTKTASCRTVTRLITNSVWIRVISLILPRLSQTVFFLVSKEWNARMWQTTDIQTDHATDKLHLAVGEIAESLNRFCLLALHMQRKSYCMLLAAIAGRCHQQTAVTWSAKSTSSGEDLSEKWRPMLTTLESTVGSQDDSIALGINDISDGLHEIIYVVVRYY